MITATNYVSSNLLVLAVVLVTSATTSAAFSLTSLPKRNQIVTHSTQSPSQSQLQSNRQTQTQTQLFSGIAGAPPKLSQAEEDNLQWDLFLKNQALGQWRGTWTSYNFMGDVIDTTTASVNLLHDTISNTVTHTHDIVMGSALSDCETCFDSEDVRTIPVATYSKGKMAKYRCASVGMCCGPSLTRSGSMSTELILYHEDTESRLRVIYQHAPVWEKGIEPGSCPPQGLKLYRVMVAKENLYKDNSKAGNQQQPDAFTKSVPPFMWHKRWAGTAWTWGTQTGDRGWSVEELEEADAWHGRPTGDTSDVWSLRLNRGGILLQCPKVITSGFAGLCRLAWLPERSEENDGAGIDSKLLRMEASVMALEPIIDEEQDVMLGFYPPSLGSLRCDTFAKIGELENTSMLDKLRSMGELEDSDKGKTLSAPITTSTENKIDTNAKNTEAVESSNNKEEPKTVNTINKDSGLDDIRNALKL